MTRRILQRASRDVSAFLRLRSIQMQRQQDYSDAQRDTAYLESVKPVLCPSTGQS